MTILLKTLFLVMALASSAPGAEVKVFEGASRYNADILCTVRDGAVYSGTSNYRSDICFTFDGHLALEEFVAVWHTVMYVW